MPLEDRFIYQPLRVGEFVGMGHDVSVSTPDGETLHGRYLPRTYAYFHLLYLHGSRGNLASRAGVFAFLCERGPSVFGIDYRGYGKSTGAPSEEGLYTDAVAAYEWLVKQTPPESVIVFGEGLGAAPAIRLAAAKSCAALVTLSAFTNLSDALGARHPYLPSSWIVKSKFDNVSTLPQVSVPKLIVHSRADDQVPFVMAERLFEAAREPKTALWLDAAEHEEVYSKSGKQLAGGIENFLASLHVPG